MPAPLQVVAAGESASTPDRSWLAEAVAAVRESVGHFPIVGGHPHGAVAATLRQLAADAHILVVPSTLPALPRIIADSYCPGIPVSGPLPSGRPGRLPNGRHAAPGRIRRRPQSFAGRTHRAQRPPVFGRTTATGQADLCMRELLTEPSNRPAIAPRPRDPTTTSCAASDKPMSW